MQGDLITTLAKIVIGEEEMIAPALADAFKHGNTALRANLAYLGTDYSTVTEITLADLPEDGEDVVIPMEQLIIAPEPNSEEGEALIEVSAAATVAARLRTLFELLWGG